jgi:hypothetical protein
MQAGTKAFQYSRGSGRKDTSSKRMMLVSIWRPVRVNTLSGRMDQWIDGRPDGMARSSGRLTRNLNSSLL